jgi:hypothetical protein
VRGRECKLFAILTSVILLLLQEHKDKVGTVAWLAVQIERER